MPMTTSKISILTNVRSFALVLKSKEFESLYFRAFLLFILLQSYSRQWLRNDLISSRPTTFPSARQSVERQPLPGWSTDNCHILFFSHSIASRFPIIAFDYNSANLEDIFSNAFNKSPEQRTIHRDERSPC